jgi:hypothetical protein
MATAPKIPENEAPFDEATLDAFPRSMSAEMVLVGGQALAFWMNRYGIRSNGATISNDGDALGNVRMARFLAERLRATLVLPDAAALTSLVAQLRIPVEGGKVRNVDVLHLLYTTSGLKKSSEFTRRVRRNALTVKIEPGFELRIMHPLDVLESRAHNAVGLIAEKGEHVVTQAKWAIAVAKAALIRLARDPAGDVERVGVHVQRIFRLWKSPVGQRLWKEHGLCVLDAVDGQALLGALPELEKQLANLAKDRPGE